MKEVQDKQQIKDIIYYLVKQAGWSFKYNSYKLTSHLVRDLKVVADYKHKLKYRQKKNKAFDKVITDKNNNSEDEPASCKQIQQTIRI